MDRESSKMRLGSNTLAFSSIFLSLVVCFVALVHVEIELHAHRQMLQVLSQQRADNFEPRKTVQNQPITSSFHSDCDEGKLRDFLSYKLFTDWDMASRKRCILRCILSWVVISKAIDLSFFIFWHAKVRRQRPLTPLERAPLIIKSAKLECHLLKTS